MLIYIKCQFILVKILKLLNLKIKNYIFPKNIKKYLSFLYNDWEKPKKNNYVTLKSLKIRNFKYFVYSGIKVFQYKKI